jgi:hypothetical protein
MAPGVGESNAGPLGTPARAVARSAGHANLSRGILLGLEFLIATAIGTGPSVEDLVVTPDAVVA